MTSPVFLDCYVDGEVDLFGHLLQLCVILGLGDVDEVLDCLSELVKYVLPVNRDDQVADARWDALNEGSGEEVALFIETLGDG